MRCRITVLLALCLSLPAKSSDTLSVCNFHYLGPYPVDTPFCLDSVDMEGKKFDCADVPDPGLPAGSLNAAPFAACLKPSTGRSVHLLGFSVHCEGFVKADSAVEGCERYALYMDGKKCDKGELAMEPGTHDFMLEVLSFPDDSAGMPSVSLVYESKSRVRLSGGDVRYYSLDLNTQGESCGGVRVSPGGRCLSIVHRNVDSDGSSEVYTDIYDLNGGRLLGRTDRMVRWMPEGDSYYFTRAWAGRKELVTISPVSGESRVICEDIPDGKFTVVPGGRYLIYEITADGPSEGDVHQILNPEDRQKGWRDRTFLYRFDMRTGLFQPLTFGHHSTVLSDVSADGRKILFMSERSRFTSRPTLLKSLFVMDLESLETDRLVADDGFIGTAQFSPDGGKVLITGSPEALGGIGNVTPEGRVPSMYDIQLFVQDISTGEVSALTRDFNPSVEDVRWNRYDGNIYFTASVKDCIKLYRYISSGGRFESLKYPEDNVYQFDMADDSPAFAYYGQSLENGDRAYSCDTRSMKHSLVCDFSSGRFGDVKFGKGEAYEFTGSRGDVINGFYVLPPDFDPSRKYPMIVHYYGGCSPTSRYAVGSYSPQLYAAQGYVFYVINPSGACGFGQEFSSRHVNTAGDMVADDIIEGTLKFCEDHPFVDTSHLGCFSASYGGFMTQLLLTRTDIYATGISHAGISDHTSYWGEGYWGYSYSEVSMAGNYPWTNKDLYVDHSPLYNADKIHTPILFLHGSADTNVPIGESIQMFTALELLGRETAMVVVDGENHGIRDYAKRRQWLRTISAWFSKYLKEDPSWWDCLYPPKTL